MLYFKFKCKPVGKVSYLQKKSLLGRLVHKLSMSLSANPDFEDKLQYVALWYLEYDETYNETWREIGVDVDNNVIVKMPDDHNYGYWLDTNYTIEDFKKRYDIRFITKQDFDYLWNSVCYDSVNKCFKPNHFDVEDTE